MILIDFDSILIDFDSILIGFGLILVWLLVPCGAHSSQSSLGASWEVPSEIVEAPNGIRRSSK